MVGPFRREPSWCRSPSFDHAIRADGADLGRFVGDDPPGLRGRPAGGAGGHVLDVGPDRIHRFRGGPGPWACPHPCSPAAAGGCAGPSCGTVRASASARQAGSPTGRSTARSRERCRPEQVFAVPACLVVLPELRGLVPAYFPLPAASGRSFAASRPCTRESQDSGAMSGFGAKALEVEFLLIVAGFRRSRPHGTAVAIHLVDGPVPAVAVEHEAAAHDVGDQAARALNHERVVAGHFAGHLHRSRKGDWLESGRFVPLPFFANLTRVWPYGRGGTSSENVVGTPPPDASRTNVGPNTSALLQRGLELASVQKLAILFRWAEKQSTGVPEHGPLTASSEFEWRDAFWDCGIQGIAVRRCFGLGYAEAKVNWQTPGRRRELRETVRKTTPGKGGLLEQRRERSPNLSGSRVFCALSPASQEPPLPGSDSGRKST